MKAVMVFLMLLFASLGPSIVMASIGSSMIEMVGRYPSSASRICLGKLALLVIAEGISMVLLLGVYFMFMAARKHT
ncbi:MAG: hypothetical protein WCG78_03495 [Candidatus Omnitrophota bacterium]